MMRRDFRYWHKAEMTIMSRNVRFEGQNGHRSEQLSIKQWSYAEIPWLKTARIRILEHDEVVHTGVAHRY